MANVQQLDRIDPRTEPSSASAHVDHACALCTHVCDCTKHSNVSEVSPCPCNDVRSIPPSPRCPPQRWWRRWWPGCQGRPWQRHQEQGVAQDPPRQRPLARTGPQGTWRLWWQCCRHTRTNQQGDPTYLVVNKDGQLENYGVNAVCTHLGCVVPWNGVRGRRHRWVYVYSTTSHHRLRTSLCALATARSTMPQARRSAARPPWYVG